MLCPFCSHEIAPIWNVLFTAHDERGRALQGPIAEIKKEVPTAYPGSLSVSVQLDWGQCHNEECHRILVRATEKTYLYNKPQDERRWLAVPGKKVPPPLNKLIVPPFAQDFIEASLILDDCPRMSSVLSRRILADLLKKYAALDDYNLATRIDKFNAEKSHPSRLRENLHYLREIGDFSAHTMEDDQGARIEVTREEAEWTVKIVADLFDYFIVGPERDKELRQQFDEKLKKAGRKPIEKPTS